MLHSWLLSWPGRICLYGLIYPGVILTIVHHGRLTKETLHLNPWCRRRLTISRGFKDSSSHRIILSLMLRWTQALNSHRVLLLLKCTSLLFRQILFVNLWQGLRAVEIRCLVGIILGVVLVHHRSLWCESVNASWEINGIFALAITYSCACFLMLSWTFGILLVHYGDKLSLWITLVTSTWFWIWGPRSL